MKNLRIFWLVIGIGFATAPDANAEVSAALEAHLQRTLKEDTLRVDDGSLYRAALQEGESLEPLMTRLDALIREDKQNFPAACLAASLQWRYGNVNEALRRFQSAAAIRAEPLVMFRVAQLLDAAGKTDEAAGQYLRTLEAKPDEELAKRIQLRLALLKPPGPQGEKGDGDLASFARKQDQNFQNRAGVILALTGRPKDALALYKAAEDGNQAFKQQIRIAEWAMAAKEMPKARESAWAALQSAKLDRDRRYALTILAESYRNENKLDELIARFAATPDLPAEARLAWIDLLREQGDFNKALALFQEAKAKAVGEGGFTEEMRRQLLDICREAGRDDLLVENFREMIAKEPRRLEWRSGLSRFYLERGERDKGKAVWADLGEKAQPGDWLAAAGVVMELGLDDLAQSFAEKLIQDGRGNERLAALQFLFDLHKARGRESDAMAVLKRMDELAAPDASERAGLAESWEQLGRQDKAVVVLEKLRQARGPENFSPDLETRLAWLYSETGAEEKAYEAWKLSWLRIDSPGRRRYVEDRLMATASRLGKLGDIAIELEEKLAAGTADKRDSALLVRLYTKVGDPVSASEIIHDFMKQSGGTDIKMLEEQALVYVMCNDYYHYEKTLRKLMELDPEGTPDYLTQLAMSTLERGRNDEARAILTEMRGLKENPASGEFEAGVLTLAGMHVEAASAYWRAVASHPDRIDTYLLLGQALQKLGKGGQAVGLYQYLVENAEEDDLFTIAIDGLLNVNNPQQGSNLRPEMLAWARRAILERLAGSDDKLYLFELLRDISEDLKDKDMMVRAMAETLPIAGERRTTQLRELMELAKVGGKDQEGMLRFGRRLIGLGDSVPPQIYLDLGSIFLTSGDIRSAVKTFAQADTGLDFASYQRKIAATFEQKLYLKSALRAYEKILLAAADDVPLLTKVGELREQQGFEAEASIAYRRALDLLVDGQPSFNLQQKKPAANTALAHQFAPNVDQFDKYFLRVLTGFLATSGPEGKATLDLINDSLAALETDLARLDKEGAKAPEGGPLSLAQMPQISTRAQLIRRLALGGGHLEKARALEQQLLKAFPREGNLRSEITQTWGDWGYQQQARTLLEPGTASGGTGNSGTRGVFLAILKGDRAGALERIGNVDKVLGNSQSAAEFELLFSAARSLGDSAAVERLARFAIDKSPQDKKLFQSIQILMQAAPSLNQAQRDNLIAYVESTIEKQAGDGGDGGQYYYYTNLQKLIGKQLRLPLRMVRSRVENMLPNGGGYNRYIATLFSFLTPEDYQILFREIFPKAKASDRLSLIFSLLRQYPGKMNPATEELFSEKAREAAAEAAAEPLKSYQSASRDSYYTGPTSPANTAFEARVLEELGERVPEEKRTGYLLEQVAAWDRAGDTARGLETARRVFSLALRDEPAFKSALSVVQKLPPAYLDAFLAVLDGMETKNGGLALENKRITLLRQTRDPERLMSALAESIRKFPKEPSFRNDLAKELDAEARTYEAIEVLEGLVALAPDNRQYRLDLQAAWIRLAHPLKARSVMNGMSEAKPAGPGSSPVTVPQRASFRPSSPSVVPSATLASVARKSGRGGQEMPLEPISTKWIKDRYEAGDLDVAKLGVRQLWRRFPSLDDAGRNRFFRLQDSGQNLYFQWSSPKSRPEAPSTPAASPDSLLGGLRAFLVAPPSAPNSPASLRFSFAPSSPSLFSAVGSEGFAAPELARWLSTFEPQEYRGDQFEEILRAVVGHRIATQGLEPFFKDAFARDLKGELGALEHNTLIAALEVHPGAGGEEATRFLERQRESLDPADLWKMLRLARCFLKRGDQESALSLYRWCGANTRFARGYMPGFPKVTADVLVKEIRENLSGPTRIRALEAVLPLVTLDSNSINSQLDFHNFMMTTWAAEVAAPEVFKRCPESCRQVLRDFVSTGNRYAGSLEMATFSLAVAGQTEEALPGLDYLLGPSAWSRTALTSTSVAHGDILRKWLPEDMTNWIHAERWLSSVAGRVRQWEVEKKLRTATAVKILSLVALRQHQNHFTDSARATIAVIGNMAFTSPEAATWFSDAARLTGNTALAVEVETKLLDQRRLPIVRVAPLLSAIAKQKGLSAALPLAEKTLDYTWERGFLQTMEKLCTEAGDGPGAQVWRERSQEIPR